MSSSEGTRKPEQDFSCAVLEHSQRSQFFYPVQTLGYPVLQQHYVQKERV